MSQLKQILFYYIISVLIQNLVALDYSNDSSENNTDGKITFPDQDEEYENRSEEYQFSLRSIFTLSILSFKCPLTYYAVYNVQKEHCECLARENFLKALFNTRSVVKCKS